MAATGLYLSAPTLPVTISRPPSRASQTSSHRRIQWENIVEIHADILEVLKETHWPHHSEDTVKRLITVVNRVPTAKSPAQDDETREHADLDQLDSLLRSVKTKLDTAAGRHGAYTGIGSYVHRSEGCNQVLSACRKEVLDVLRTFRTGELNRSSSSLGRGSSPDSTGGRSDPTSRSDQHSASAHEAASTLNGKSAVKNDLNASSARRKELLDATNKTFKGVEMVSGNLPIIGSYIGAAAGVGVACVEIAQLMDSNEEEAKMLQARITRLSEILRPFESRSANNDQLRSIKVIEYLQRELQGIHEEIKVLNSSSTFAKTRPSSHHADSLKGFQENVRVTLEELQVGRSFIALVSLAHI
ncbi:hypothetical protein M407DRAFT_33838 [Tulasnella calospora MUT 4182]|uniref:Uncharacterized protein n=1 Tax=Tulasnella calospora MUT 4182 TaxID=1051891 RepID=A0A0C3K551_9AGAM|nr:hypothetical protein M407DRAFT_33838 [Tulasnella calospora MUT 4182]